MGYFTRFLYFATIASPGKRIIGYFTRFLIVATIVIPIIMGYFRRFLIDATIVSPKIILDHVRDTAIKGKKLAS